MKVLVACEESQRVCTAFREKGHEAYSCDIMECSGGTQNGILKGMCYRLLTDIKHQRIYLLRKMELRIAFQKGGT